MMDAVANLRDDVDWGNPVNRSHPLNRGLVSWCLAVPNRMGWGSFTWRDLLRRYDGAFSGSLVPSTAWASSRGRRGGVAALYFGGNSADYISAGTLPIATFAQISISLWVKRDSSFDSNGRYWSALHSGPDDIRIWSSNGSTNLTFTMDDGSTSGQISTTLDTDWHHIVALHDGTTQRLYIDAVQVGSGNAKTFDYAGGSGLVNIARPSTGASSSHYRGLIGDVRVLSRALSTAEIRSLYGNSLQGYPNLLNRVPLPRYAPQEAAPPGGFIDNTNPVLRHILACRQFDAP